MPWVVPPRLLSDWSLVAWHPCVLILSSFVQCSQDRRYTDFDRLLYVNFRVLMIYFFIRGIPTETMSIMRAVLSMLFFFLGLNSYLFSIAKCATHMPVVLFLTTILLLLNTRCKYSLNGGSSLEYSEKRFITYFSLRKREGNAIISPKFSWRLSRTFPINRVHHCSSGGTPTGKSLS